MEALLQAAKVADPIVASQLGPNVENARGATPSEIIVEDVAKVWESSGQTQQAGISGGLFGFTPQTRRLKSSKASASEAKVPEETRKRRCHRFLQSLACSGEAV